MTTIGVIADDLTGAAELGAIGLHHGLRSEIIVPQLEPGSTGTEGRPPAGLPGAILADAPDLVCIDTNSRSCPPGEAGRRAAGAAALLCQAGVRWIYKKVDSVLRGQVTAEVEAVMQELGVKRALLVPANPSLGRTIKRGRYYIHGKPIHKTEFARDPEHPRSSPDLLKLLGASLLFPICLCAVLDASPSQGIIVGAAGSDEDLKRWAARRTSKTLAAGGAEFFTALLAKTGRAKVALSPAPAEATAAGGRELFVCGTLSDSARRFVSAARAGGMPVFSLPKELVWGAGFSPAAAEAIGQKVVAALRLHPRVLLTVGLRVVHEPTIARWLADPPGTGGGDRSPADQREPRLRGRRRDGGGTGQPHGLDAPAGAPGIGAGRSHAGGRRRQFNVPDYQARQLCVAGHAARTGPAQLVGFQRLFFARRYSVARSRRRRQAIL